MRNEAKISAAAIVTAALLAGGVAQAHAQSLPPAFSLPVSCAFGRDCFVQQYADVDPGPEFRDYACGQSSYDGHKGIDIRVLSLKRIVREFPVLAAADGRVKGVRDGMADRLMLSEDDRRAVTDRECGNGVVIDHGAGWETQVCHLKRGSLKVRQGETVTRGQALGAIGASGAAAFAHVHFGVRHNGAPISPVLGRPLADGCAQGGQAAGGPGLWTADAYETLKSRGTEIIEAGFADGPVSPAEAEAGTVGAVDANSAALVLFARVTNTQAGDIVRLSLEGPGGFAVRAPAAAIERRKAQYVSFAGKRRTAARWPAGRYLGRVDVVRDGVVIRTRDAELEIR